MTGTSFCDKELITEPRQAAEEEHTLRAAFLASSSLLAPVTTFKHHMHISFDQVS